MDKYESLLEEDYTLKVRALASFMGADNDQIVEVCALGGLFKVGAREWRVLTDAEADIAVDDILDSYLEDNLLPNIPEAVCPYFDSDTWKADARRRGRGCNLSAHEGIEHTVEIDGETFCLYRIN